jgi:hypothetical protein
MVPFYIAYIPPQHYQAVRRILYGHIPDTMMNGVSSM